MHILIIGGSGRTGKLVVDEALKRGHVVTALVRNPSSLQKRANLFIVKGSPLQVEDIRSAFSSNDDSPPTAVIVTLNALRKSDSPFAAPIGPPNLMVDSHTAILTVMNERNVRKIVTMAAFGVGDSLPNLHFLLRLLFSKSNMKFQIEDHGLVDSKVKKSGVDFVLVRPVMLADGEAKPIKDHGDFGEGVGMMANITRKSVAGFLVDAAEMDKWDKRTPVLSN